MTRYDSLYSDTGVQPHHVVAGILAALLSVGFHFAMLYFFADVRFDIGRREAEQARRVVERRQDAIRVKRIDREVRPKRELGPSLARPEAGGGEAPVGPEATLTAPELTSMAPPAVTRDLMAGSTASLEMPDAMPEPPVWEPRQELVAVVERHVPDLAALLPRREIPVIERVVHAPDEVGDYDMKWVRPAPREVSEYVSPAPSGTNFVEAPLPQGGVAELPEGLMPEPEGSDAGAAELFPEAKEEVTEYTPMETLLRASVSQYRPRDERDVTYLRIEIDRLGAEVLPVVPKDVVFVQDCSASMAEERLHFCREGLIEGLTSLGPQDRFNVLAFRESSSRCFPSWAPVNISSIEQARQFIGNMTSAGETDIFTSMQDVLALKRDPVRPLIVLLVTDGRSTTGLTQSSRIIGEFTKANDGAVSVFAMGTRKGADLYLLDLLSYCNRGTSEVAVSGRWSIPKVLKSLIHSTRRPVLANVRFRFDEGSRSEVHPELTSNLYEDRPLVLYVRCPASTGQVVFQARGEAGEAKCDMIFTLDLDGRVQPGDDSIRKAWARQRIYDLMGRHARQPDPELVTEIRRTSRDYKLPLPYQP